QTAHQWLPGNSCRATHYPHVARDIRFKACFRDPRISDTDFAQTCASTKTCTSSSMKTTPMPNRNLNADELKRANQLLAAHRERLTSLAVGDPLLLFAYRRQVVKELGYDERAKPSLRAQLKAIKWGQQNGKCADCSDELALKYSELDRKNAADGYKEEHTELV